MFQGTGGQIAYTVDSSVSSGDSSISVSYALAGVYTGTSVNSISNVSKDLGGFDDAFNNSSLTGSTTSLTFDSNDAASAFHTKGGGSGSVIKIVDSSDVTLLLTLGSSPSSSSVSVSASISGGSTIFKSNISSMTVKQSSPHITLTLDGGSAVSSFDVSDHDASASGLHLAGTLVTATAAELNVMDGDTTAASVTLASSDGVVLNDGGTMKQALVSDFGTFLGGDGLQVSSGQLSLDAVKQTVHGSGNLTNDVTASLSQEPLADSVQVFLNGVLQTAKAGSGLGASVFDYTLEGSGSSQKVVFEAGVVDGDDAVVIHYIKK